MMNYDSSKNQNIKREFVRREVFSNVGLMVEYILNKGMEDREAPFSLDDLINYYIDNSEKIEELHEQIEEIENEISEIEEQFDNEKIDQEEYDARLEKLENLKSEIEGKIEELEREQDEPQEPYEWWIVSSWLCNKLKEKGEVVLEDENIWGRCCTGQAILLDSVISDICEEMGILEGQEHEWKV